MTHAVGRRAAERRGRRAEQVAALYLMLTGWKILARRRQLPQIEVDIVARRGGLVAIVEVKYRRSLDAAAVAVSRGAARRLGAAATQIAAETGCAARVDMIAIAPWRWPRHVTDIATDIAG